MKKSHLWTLAMAVAAAIGGSVSLDIDDLDDVSQEVSESGKSEPNRGIGAGKFIADSLPSSKPQGDGKHAGNS
jgi:hypothetical protein